MERDIGRKINKKYVPRLQTLAKNLAELMNKKGPMGIMSVEGGKITAEMSFLSFDQSGTGRLNDEEFSACMRYSGSKSGIEYSQE